MEDFLLIVKNYDYANVTPEQMQQGMEAYRAWKEKLVAMGRYKSGSALEPTTGRYLKDKSTVLTDGPFLESKEIIGGYALISAKDYDEAVEFAKECPLLNRCELEIRKLFTM